MTVTVSQYSEHFVQKYNCSVVILCVKFSVVQTLLHSDIILHWQCSVDLNSAVEM